MFKVNKKPLSLIKMQLFLFSEIDIGYIDNLHTASIISKSDFEKRVNKEIEEIESESSLPDNIKHEIISYYSDESYVNEQTIDLAGEMQVIALYKNLEVAIKKMLEVGNLPKIKKGENSSMASACSEVGIDIKTLENFAAFDELRLINNCIKHNDGKVDDKLDKYNGLVKGNKISNPHGCYERLKYEALDFIKVLMNEILNRVQDKLADTPVS